MVFVFGFCFWFLGDFITTFLAFRSARVSVLGTLSEVKEFPFFNRALERVRRARGVFLTLSMSL